MLARRQNVIVKARSRLGRGVEKLLFMAVYRQRELFQIISETSCRGSCQLPLQNCSLPTRAAVAEWDEASALALLWAVL